jgi:hypothetical protein
MYALCMEILDTQKLRIELAKINKSHAWLAKQIGFSRQYMGWIVKTKSVVRIDDMAEVLNMGREDLIK